MFNPDGDQQSSSDEGARGIADVWKRVRSRESHKGWSLGLRLFGTAFEHVTWLSQ